MSTWKVTSFGVTTQLLECAPEYVQVLLAYTSHSPAPVVQSVEPISTVALRTRVWFAVEPVPTVQLEPGSTPGTPNTSIVSLPFIKIKASSPLK